jgi:Bacterial PH domain
VLARPPSSVVVQAAESFTVSSAPQPTGPAAGPGLGAAPSPNGVPGHKPGAPGVARKPDLYRSPVAPLIWWVWVAFAVANLADLAAQGRNHFAAVIATILILVTGVFYIAAFRPRVLADDEGMTIKNPFRNHRIPWNCVREVALGDSLEVSCAWQDTGGEQRKRVFGWAVHSPRRSRLKAEMRARRQQRTAERQSPAFGKLPQDVKDAMSKTDAEHIVSTLENRAARARSVAEPTSGPVASWHWLSVAALVLPALLVLVVALV